MMFHTGPSRLADTFRFPTLAELTVQEPAWLRMRLLAKTIVWSKVCQKSLLDPAMDMCPGVQKMN